MIPTREVIPIREVIPTREVISPQHVIPTREVTRGDPHPRMSSPPDQTISRKMSRARFRTNLRSFSLARASPSRVTTHARCAVTHTRAQRRPPLAPHRSC